MQFYSNSTELTSTNKEQYQYQSFFTSLQQANSPTLNPAFFFYYYHNYYQQFCALSTQLNNELVVNNSLIELKSSALTV